MRREERCSCFLEMCHDLAISRPGWLAYGLGFSWVVVVEIHDDARRIPVSGLDVEVFTQDSAYKGLVSRFFDAATIDVERIIHSSFLTLCKAVQLLCALCYCRIYTSC